MISHNPNNPSEKQNVHILPSICGFYTKPQNDLQNG